MIKAIAFIVLSLKRRMNLPADGLALVPAIREPEPHDLGGFQMPLDLRLLGSSNAIAEMH